MACKCTGSDRMQNWRVVRRHTACSAFEGYRWRWSAYSYVKCLCCGAFWRTKAAYVERLPDEGEESDA